MHFLFSATNDVPLKGKNGNEVLITCVEKGRENVTLSNVSNAYHNGVRYNQMGNTTDLCLRNTKIQLVFYVRSPNRFCIIGKNHVKSSTTYQHHNTCVNIYNFFSHLEKN